MKVIIICAAIIVMAYLLFLGIGMSSTHPPIAEYSFHANTESFKRLLSRTIDTYSGWSLVENDTVSTENEACCWTSLFYRDSGRSYEYSIKYCGSTKNASPETQGVRVEVIGAFDHNTKTGGYKISDQDVPRLLEFVESTLLKKMKPEYTR